MDQWSDTAELQKAAASANGANPIAPADDPVSSNGSALTHKKEVTNDDATPEDVSEPPSHHAAVQTFPKEFNRNYFESLDRRYLVILILTLLLEPLTIWYLLRTRPLDSGEQTIARLQNKYAELFLSEFKVENPPLAAPMETDLLSRAAEAVPQILEDSEGKLPSGVGGSGKSLNLPSLRPNRSKASPEAAGLSGENRAAQRRLNSATRQRGMQALSEEVERIGLLGVITAGSSGLVSRVPITDLLQYADSTIVDIDNAIAQVQQLRVPRAGIDYFGPSVGLPGSGRASLGNELFRTEEVYIAEKEVRGARATSSGVMAEDIVDGLATATQKSIERNQEFEPVAATPGLLPANSAESGTGPFAGITGLRGRAIKGPATRDRDHIREIVLAHSPAIQDCYRRQLKGNSALKGKVSVRFTVNPAGHISEAEIVKSEMAVEGVPVQLPQMEECILAKIRKWRDFGQVDESLGEVTFRQTYNFGY